MQTFPGKTKRYRSSAAWRLLLLRQNTSICRHLRLQLCFVTYSIDEKNPKSKFNLLYLQTQVDLEKCKNHRLNGIDPICHLLEKFPS